MISRLLLFTLLFCINLKSYSQIYVSKTEVDYSLKVERDGIHRILTFGKDKDSNIYTSVKYSVSDFNTIVGEKKLKDEINTMEELWSIAQDSIKYDLQSFNIGYPATYSDILNNHIKAFLESKEWQTHVEKNGKKLNYDLIKKIMLESNVYKPLYDFLKTIHYTFIGFETEKHGFITENELQTLGYSGKEIIPMPFMVWIKIEKIE